MVAGSDALSEPKQPRRSFASFAAMLTIFTTIFASNLPSPLYSVWQAEWGFSSTALTAVFAIYVLGVVVMLPIAGQLSDLVGRRQMMLPGMIFTLLAAVVFAAAADLYWLALGRFLTGIGTGLVTGAATAALLELDPRGNRARAGTISTLIFTAGATCGPLFSSAALRWLPAPTVMSFVVAAGLALFSIIVLVRVQWPLAGGQGWRGLTLRHCLPHRLSIPRDTVRGFVMAGAAVALTWSTGSLYSSLGPTLAVDLVGVRDRAAAGLFIAAFQFIGGISQYLFRQQPSQRVMMAGPAVLAFGMVIGTLGIFQSSIPLFITGTIVAALGSGAAAVGSIALISQLAPDARRGEMLSAFYMVAYGTMATAVLGIGALSDLIGLKWTVTLLTGLLVGIAAWLTMASLRRFPVMSASFEADILPGGERSADYR